MRILVVEDDALVSMMLEDILDELGHQVVGPAATVDEAFRLMDMTEIDVAILDVNLYQENSYPVADALLKRGKCFAFASGYGPAGIDPVYRTALLCPKPFSEDTLKAVVDELAACAAEAALTTVGS